MNRTEVRDLRRARRTRSWEAERYGGRVARLGRLADHGVPVADGFVIAPRGANPDERWRATQRVLGGCVRRLERRAGRRLGDPRDPLLLVARLSPPDRTTGLRPSARCVGLTPLVAQSLGERLGNAVLGRLLGQFLEDIAIDVLGADPDAAREPGPEEEVRTWYGQEVLLPWKAVIEDAQLQLWETLKDRLRPRAVAGIESAAEPVVLLVQRMALADAGGPSGVGMVRQRSPAGERIAPELRFGGRPAAGGGTDSDLRRTAASLAAQAEDVLLEATDLSFVVEGGEASVIDATPLRLEPGGAAEVAVEWARAGRLTREEAVLRIEPQQLERQLHARIGDTEGVAPVCRGIAAAPGAAAGRIVFSASAVERLAARGRNSILAKIETSPEDISSMHAAAAVLTLRGGMTSHAAVVARGLGRPCVTGIREVSIDPAAGTLRTARSGILREGDPVTVDGSGGAVYAGALPTLPPQFGGAMAVLLGWADGMRRLGVRANADTAEDASLARDYGADGVGLCRTEHMFFAQNRLTAMREIILAGTLEERCRALERLLPMQRQDFLEIFTRMRGRPVVVRLLDPPLHEFLPREEGEIEELAEAMGLEPHRVRERAAALEEFNPMLGHRGCRVGIAHPEIYDMQTRAILEAACSAWEATGEPAVPELMIPLVSAQREMEILRERIDAVAARVGEERGRCVRYRVGAMIETPRAALRAGAITRFAQFLSFGTNDLTQMAYGLSRDDAGRFLPDYLRQGVFEIDPFESIDREGVGELIRLAAERGRDEDPDTVLGLCGEHGADPASVDFCESIGIHYVSCSPFRVPVARLAAAQASLAARQSRASS